MNRARKSGIAKDIELKMEEIYDKEEAFGTPDRIMDWMFLTLENDHPIPDTPINKISWRTLNCWLRDGVALCKMINKLLVAAGKEPVKYVSPVTSSFQAMENIESFNHGCIEYGLPPHQTFNTIDLFEAFKGPFLNVINCLNKLGFEANRQGFQPDYEAIEAPTRDLEVWGDK